MDWSNIPSLRRKPSERRITFPITDRKLLAASIMTEIMMFAFGLFAAMLAGAGVGAGIGAIVGGAIVGGVKAIIAGALIGTIVSLAFGFLNDAYRRSIWDGVGALGGGILGGVAAGVLWDWQFAGFIGAIMGMVIGGGIVKIPSVWMFGREQAFKRSLAQGLEKRGPPSQWCGTCRAARTGRHEEGHAEHR